MARAGREAKPDPNLREPNPGTEVVRGFLLSCGAVGNWPTRAAQARVRLARRFGRLARGIDCVDGFECASMDSRARSEVPVSTSALSEGFPPTRIFHTRTNTWVNRMLDYSCFFLS